MTRVIEHPDGLVEIEEAGDRRRLVTVSPADGPAPARIRSYTTYPDELIEHVLAVKGVSHLCDEIDRDEDPDYVRHFLELTVLTYVEPSELAGKRILDFGSGSGGSTLNLARIFPGSEIVGVELVGDHVDLARERAAHHGVDRVSFVHAPGGTSLPDAIDEFDAIVLSAVYEHLLPIERQELMPALWAILRPGGLFLVNQLPHRYSPLETHTTGLPLINYLPDRAALALARRLSARVAREESWEDLLRRGIRGGTVNTIVRELDAGAEATLIEPRADGISDRIDLWFALSSRRWLAVKRVARAILKALRASTGVVFVPELSLAFRKIGRA